MKFLLFLLTAKLFLKSFFNDGLEIVGGLCKKLSIQVLTSNKHFYHNVV